MEKCLDQIDAALALRAPLLADPTLTACRLFNGQADGVAGLVVEKLADILIVQFHEDRLQLDLDTVRTLATHVHRQLGTRAVYRKMFLRDRAYLPEQIVQLHRDAQPWIGENVSPQIVVEEFGQRMRVRPYDGFSVGLFLEHRENRRRIRELAPGRRVLNTFSYTGGFSVAAALGGATTVDSVDLSKRYLEWSKSNFAENGISLDNHRFFCSDVFDFYRRATRQDRRYDLIVLDPPTFARLNHPKRVFRIEDQLENLVAGAVDRLNPEGIILLATNHRDLSADHLAAALRTGAEDRACTVLDQPRLPLDFAGDPDYSKTVLARYD